MKVVHVIGGYINNGAARAALSVHEELLRQGVSSKVISNSKLQIADKNIDYLLSNPKAKFKEKCIALLRIIVGKVFYPKTKEVVFHTSLLGHSIHKHPWVREADVVNLHWVADTISLLQISKIKKPLVWVLHDIWPFTGGCHCSFECRGFETNCSACQMLPSYWGSWLSGYLWKQKKKHYPKQIHFVAVSNWIKNEALSSTLLANAPISYMPNILNNQRFRRRDKTEARKKLSINTKKRIIGIGSQYMFSAIKGFDLFLESLKYLDTSKYFIAIFGKDYDPDLFQHFEHTYFGFLTNDEDLCNLYSALDVFICPSRQESFGLSVIESIACYTPVVAFNNTGPKDIITHKKTGYLAEAFSAQEIAQGIDFWCNDKNKFDDKMADKTVQKFSAQRVAKEYVKLYDSII